MPISLDDICRVSGPDVLRWHHLVELVDQYLQGNGHAHSSGFPSLHKKSFDCLVRLSRPRLLLLDRGHQLPMADQEAETLVLKILDGESLRPYAVLPVNDVFLSYTVQEGQPMPRGRMVYISEAAHQKLKLLAVRRNRPMGEVVEELVEQDLADLLNPWTSTEGLILQQHALAQVWDDPALDVYNDD